MIKRENKQHQNKTKLRGELILYLGLYRIQTSAIITVLTDLHIQYMYHEEELIFPRNKLNKNETLNKTNTNAEWIPTHNSQLYYNVHLREN